LRETGETIFPTQQVTLIAIALYLHNFSDCRSVYKESCLHGNPISDTCLFWVCVFFGWLFCSVLVWDFLVIYALNVC